MKNSQSPIGIFDSGIGGLTVAKAIMQMLPNEEVIYFGDTAHLPYGEKSIPAIQSYSLKITNFLLSRGCKLISIACNTASAAAFEMIKEFVGKRALVANVIDPVVDLIAQNYADRHVGVIATRATIGSGSYQRKLKAKGIAQVSAMATPLLASMVEEGFFNNAISHALIEKYLSDNRLAGIETLVLGCTHYPLIKHEIEDFYAGQVAVVDGVETIAHTIYKMLSMSDLLRKNDQNPPHFQGFVSDLTESFELSSEIFLGKRVRLYKQVLD